MIENKDFFKNINDRARETNIGKNKRLEYWLNPSDYSIEPYETNIFKSQDSRFFPKTYLNEFNDYGYRSDQFSKSHDGKHILFAGCSQTFGFALMQEEMWSRILYEKINETTKCSGYFNLSVSGSGIQFIISNIFKYFKNFGNPDYIFLNLPDNLRFIGYISETDTYNKITFKTKDIEVQRFFSLINYHYYLMLEEYCNTNKIKLYSVTWNVDEPKYYNTNDLFNNFKTFIHIDSKKMHSDIVNDEHKYDSQYYYYARDNAHDGFGYNIWLANFLYDAYIKDIKEIS